MNKKVIGIVGSYRKNGITDQTVDAVLSAAREKGAETEKVYLIDKHIEFCTNCRVCTNDDAKKKRGRCIFKDDMDELLPKIEAADGIVLGIPINVGEATAVTKRFIERLVVYYYWPWPQAWPKQREKGRGKRAVLITSSATPAFIGRFLMPCTMRIMKDTAQFFGAKIVKSIYFGMVCFEQNPKLNKKQLSIAAKAGKELAR